MVHNLSVCFDHAYPVSAEGAFAHNASSAAEMNRTSVVHEPERLAKVFGLLHAAGTAAASEPLAGGRSFVDLARQKLGRKSATTEAMLADPVYGPPYSALVRIADWVTTTEGQSVNQRAAELIIAAETTALEQAFGDVGFATFLDEVADATKTPVQEIQQPQRAVNRRDFRKDVEVLDVAAEYYRRRQMEAIDPLERYEAAMKEIAPHQQRWAPVLMGDFRFLGAPVVGFDNLFAAFLAAAPQGDGQNIRRAVEAGLTSAARVAGLHKNESRNFISQIDPVLRAAGYVSSSEKRLAFVTFVARLFDPFEGEARQSIFSKRLTRAQIVAEVDSLVGKAVGLMTMNGSQKDTLKKFTTGYFAGYYRGYLPESGEPISANSLSLYQKRTLSAYSLLLVELKRRHDAQASTLAQKPAALPSSKGLSREARIASYRAAEEQRVFAGIAASTASLSHTTEQMPQQAVLQEQEDVPNEQPLEQIIAERAVSAKAAENVLAMYDGLPPTDKENVELALRELFHPANRRLHLQTHGTVGVPMPRSSYSHLYLRVAGQLPIRIPFGVSPGEGLKLISAFPKHNEAEEDRLFRKAEADWQRYLDARKRD